jgi:hypothetical protein
LVTPSAVNTGIVGFLDVNVPPIDRTLVATLNSRREKTRRESSPASPDDGGSLLARGVDLFVGHFHAALRDIDRDEEVVGCVGEDVDPRFEIGRCRDRQR